MTLHDRNGKITIDEAAAQRDIDHLRKSCELVKQAEETMKSIEAISADFSGDSGVAIHEAGYRLMKDYDKLAAELESIMNLISSTVEKYQKMDAELKSHIQNS